MAYNEEIAFRVRKLLQKRNDITEKKMFGGHSFLLSGNMCCGVLNDDLVLRVDPKRHKYILEKPHTRPMDFTGKPLSGFVYVDTGGYTDNNELMQWINISIDYVSSLPKKSSREE